MSNKLQSILTEALEHCSSASKPSLNKIKFGKTQYVSVPLFVEYYNNAYSYNEMMIDYRKYNYNDLVDMFIKNVYSDKEMIAIINNYLLDPSDEKLLLEFNEMQAVRKEAKNLAKQLLTDYPMI